MANDSMRVQCLAQSLYAWVILASMVLLLANCGSRTQPPSEAATPPIAMQWDEVVLPSGARLRHLSPDLRWVIYDIDDSSGTRRHQTYWLARIESGELINPMIVSEHAQKNRVRSWGFSPDSSSFMFEFRSDEGQSFKSELWLINTTNLEDRRIIYTGPALLGEGSWSPDNRHIAVFNSNWGADLLTIDEAAMESIVPSGTFGKVLTTLSWSPTGKQIVYPESHRESWNVWIADPKSGERRLLLTNNAPVNPIWSPSGESIALLGFVNGVNGEPGLEVINTDGEIQFSINLPGWSSWRGVWSPEGTRFAVALQGQIGVVTLSTGELSKIPIESDGDAQVCGWTVDGRAIILAISRSEKSVILRLPIIPE